MEHAREVEGRHREHTQVTQTPEQLVCRMALREEPHEVARTHRSGHRYAGIRPDLPHRREGQGDLCWAIGESKSISLQPRDRLFFRDNCACVGDQCFSKGGKKHKAALQAARKGQERRDRALAECRQVRDSLIEKAKVALEQRQAEVDVLEATAQKKRDELRAIPVSKEYEAQANAAYQETVEADRAAIGAWRAFYEAKRELKKLEGTCDLSDEASR